ncbi:MAG: sulfatase-like hydrolase/transferase [Planctomycetaceae bacterium]
MIARIDQLPTLPQLLGAQGYVSHQSGKWWEGSYRQGGFTQGMTRGFPEAGGRHGDDGLTIGRQGLEPVFDFVKQAVADKKPFFLWYAPFLPHTPHNPPERLLSRYRDKVKSLSVARYYAMCEWADENCGALLDFLEHQGLAENTLIVYIADNGWIQDPDSDKFAPRSKLSPYEGGVRQPILLSWPGTIPAQKYETPISSIDLAPTILSAAGAQAPESLPGRDLLPAIRDGQPLSARPLFGEGFSHDVFDFADPEASLLYRWTIDGPWKLILTYDGEVGRDRDVHPRTEQRPQLFHLEVDPQETANVAADHPELVARLAHQIAAWRPVKSRKTISRWSE